jgi:dolichol-phosphate mannosyltransferase
MSRRAGSAPARPLAVRSPRSRARDGFRNRRIGGLVRAPVRAAICLPTYNERENLEPMLRSLGGVLGRHDRVLVIDDNSPDGTGRLADRLASELTYVDVLHRPRKEGLGPAYLSGFRYALELGAELVISMDCDFSHDPADVPRLIAAAADADVVLGSRYTHGGGHADWKLGRRLLSTSASLYARTVLGVPVRDIAAGFKCLRRAVLEGIDLDAVSSTGYAVSIEITYRALRAGFRVVEIPITFSGRAAGRSKMSIPIVLEALKRVPALRLAAMTGWL